jgi:predicted DNA-binding ribbon-helix-helix protein
VCFPENLAAREIHIWYQGISVMALDFSGNSTLVSGNVTIAGHRTSLRLEPEMWDALKDICTRERRTIHEIYTRINERRTNGTSLTAAVRKFMVGYYRNAATEDGHWRAGHGSGEPFA